ncbi:MAG: hypothetical protein MK105_10120 [Crocinitomicaceae bacterium]|nr:hypothetical protein [Crocinitomicaceae bacterium]
MKKSILVLFTVFIGLSSFGQSECFIRLQKAFDDRGSYTVSDDMHRNVIISYFQDGGGSFCISGKARVENGLIVSIFLQYDDNTYELMEKDFYNSKKNPPTIVNGITEMIYNADSEKFKIVFIDQLKPKKKSYKSVSLPDDI